jgi:ferredoxin, 2Fe-2S
VQHNEISRHKRLSSHEVTEMLADRPTQETAPAEVFDPALADGAFHVVDRSGLHHLLPGVNGFRLMEIMRECGLDIPANCGGSCLCGTCHIVVDAVWAARLPQPRNDEEAMLDQLSTLTPHSRLACQIIWNGEMLDGLRVTLAPLEA